MNRLILLVIAALTLGLQMGAVAAPAAAVSQPPALFMPQGGRVVTEINVSDADVLSVVKLMLCSNLAPVNGAGVRTDLVSEAIAGVKNVRITMVQMPKAADPAKVMKDAEAWVGKAGKFTKILADPKSPVGQAVVFAQEGNMGYVAFAYDSEKCVLYAGRIVGSVDIAKLMEFASGLAPVAEIIGLPIVPVQPAAAPPATPAE